MGAVLALVLFFADPDGRERVTRLVRAATVPAVAYLALVIFGLRPTDVASWLMSTYTTVGVTLVALSATVVIGYLVTAPEGVGAHMLATRPLVGLGRISYGLYLWHFPIFWVIALKAPLHSVGARVALQFAVSIAVATVSWFAIEKPVRRLRHRVGPAAA